MRPLFHVHPPGLDVQQAREADNPGGAASDALPKPLGRADAAREWLVASMAGNPGKCHGAAFDDTAIPCAWLHDHQSVWNADQIWSSNADVELGWSTRRGLDELLSPEDVYPASRAERAHSHPAPGTAVGGGGGVVASEESTQSAEPLLGSGQSRDGARRGKRACYASGSCEGMIHDRDPVGA